MTPYAAKVDAKIAEWRGFPFRKPTHGHCCTCQVCGYDHDDCFCGHDESLEKMSEAEVIVWERGLADEYATALWGIVVAPKTEELIDHDSARGLRIILFAGATATATQRATALCRVIDQLEGD